MSDHIERLAEVAFSAQLSLTTLEPSELVLTGHYDEAKVGIQRVTGDEREAHEIIQEFSASLEQLLRAAVRGYDPKWGEVYPTSDECWRGGNDLNQRDEARRDTIAAIDLVIATASKERARLVGDCAHVIRKTARRHEGAVCLVCKSRFGWYCPTSPTRFCIREVLRLEDGASFTWKGGVRIVVDTSKYDPITVGQTHVRAAHGYCLYCGEPKERK